MPLHTAPERQHWSADAHEGFHIGSGWILGQPCSSMARYGAGRIPFTEEQRPAPQDPYGIAKYATELLVANVCETQGVEFVTAVPHNIIGPRQKYNDPYRNVAAIVINRMLQGKRPIIYGDGEQKRCFSFVEDCVDPLIKMGCLPDLSGEVINIGPDDKLVTIRQLVGIIGELLESDLEPVFVAVRPREVRYATCSADKARNLLGYEARMDVFFQHFTFCGRGNDPQAITDIGNTTLELKYSFR